MRQFRGRIGARTCTTGDVPRRRWTRRRSCARSCANVVDARMFHQILTPNHDARHADHCHVEVMRNTGWTPVE